MQAFTPTQVQVPYLYRFALSRGVPVMVKPAGTNKEVALSVKHIPQYHDEYFVSHQDKERLNNLKAQIEKNTKFVYFGKTMSLRVSKEALRGDVLTMDDEFFFKFDGKDSVIQISEAEANAISDDKYPVFEVFDTEHSLAVAATRQLLANI